VLTILYVCSIAFYNFFGLSVAKQLTTVHRTFIDSLRTVVVCMLYFMPPICLVPTSVLDTYSILPFVVAATSRCRFGSWS
jgi:hypothetical protein